MVKIAYDVAKFPFQDSIMDVLETMDLYHLNTIHYDLFDREHDQSSHWHKLYYKNNEAFLELYEEFIKEVIAPLFSEPILYQKIPTFRVQLHENVSVGEFHRDRDYNHSPFEVNFHLPFTDTNEMNSIWVESEEGKEDFAPQIVSYGQVLMFDGANLKHGNKINTSDTTRVSVDFRVLPISQYVESEKESINTKMKFKKGDYYELL